MTQEEKKKKISFFWSLIGGLIFSAFMLPSSFLNLREVLITGGIFIIGTGLFVWLIYWLNKKSETNRIIHFLILSLSLLTFIFIFFHGYKLGFFHTLFYSFFGFLSIALIDTFLLIKPKRTNDASLILLVVVIILYIFGWQYQDILNCKRMGGFFGGMGVCYPNNELTTKEKNMFGATINIPGQETQQAKLRYRKGEELWGTIKDSETGKSINGKVVAYPKKIINNSSRFNFLMPFAIDHKNGKTYSYLGFFSFPERNIREHYYFYKYIEHADSFLLGENISIGEIKIENGRYYKSITQEYFEAGERKETKIRLDMRLAKFVLYKECEEIGQVVERVRGDGEKYKICVMSENKICELEEYKKGNCPQEGLDYSRFSEVEAYCALTGNFPLKGVCNIPEKNIECDLNDYFNGKCD